MSNFLLRPMLTAAIFCLTAVTVFGQDAFSAKLTGFKEVANTGPVNSPGSGHFQLTISETGDALTYTLTYSALSTPVTQAHVHFGEPFVSAGVMFFLCTNLGNGPAGTPACPTSGGTVTGTITAGSIVGPTGQNVTPGDFAAALKIIRTGDGYVNVHTVKFPVGEIRGQLTRSDDDN